VLLGRVMCEEARAVRHRLMLRVTFTSNVMIQFISSSLVPSTIAFLLAVACGK
jgi:hypothetical protein